MTTAVRKIACILATDGATARATLAAAAARWRRDGARVVGVIDEPHGLPDRQCAAGILRDIASGTPHRMYLESAPSGTSCHLDATGVIAAAAALRDQIAASDVVVLSKFGKLEAAQSGLAEAFAAAIAADKPVLTTVSAKHRAAWAAFAPDADYLAADAASLDRWWRAQRQDAPSPR
jgi:G3E family GTPase